MLKNKAYDFLKWFAIGGIPAIGLAYSKLATVWNLPYATQIPETLDIISVLLAAFLMWQNYQFKQNFEIFTAPKVQPAEDASPILPEDLTAEIKKEEIE